MKLFLFHLNMHKLAGHLIFINFANKQLGTGSPDAIMINSFSISLAAF